MQGGDSFNFKLESISPFLWHCVGSAVISVNIFFHSFPRLQRQVKLPESCKFLFDWVGNSRTGSSGELFSSWREDLSLQPKRGGPVQLQQVHCHCSPAGVCHYDSCERRPGVLEGITELQAKTSVIILSLNWFLLTISLLYSQLLEQDVFGSVFFELTAMVVCEPSSVGFNMADVEVMKNLPEVCVPLLKALLASPYRSHLESSLRRKISRQWFVDHFWVVFHFEFRCTMSVI